MALEIQSAVAATFTSHIKSIFRLLQEPNTSLELIEVADGSKGDWVSFALLFRGPQQPVLSQQIYSVEHEILGSFDLFLVPVRADQQGVEYEAVFNRMAAPKSTDR